MGPVGVAVSGAEITVSPQELSVVVQKRLGNEGKSEASLRLDVRFTIAAGFTILFGASGAGKTTVLDCIAGLQKPDSGHIAVGNDLLFSSEKGIDLPARSRNLGYLFQTLALFPHMTARQNIEYGLRSLERQERDARTHEIAESLDRKSVV